MEIVSVVALGGFFEFYELFMTGFVSPGLIRDGIFQTGPNGLFHLPDQAAFGSVTFLGLFLGTITLGGIADRDAAWPFEALRSTTPRQRSSWRCRIQPLRSMQCG
jgi:hypothetical protein